MHLKSCIIFMLHKKELFICLCFIFTYLNILIYNYIDTISRKIKFTISTSINKPSKMCANLSGPDLQSTEGCPT